MLYPPYSRTQSAMRNIGQTLRDLSQTRAAQETQKAKHAASMAEIGLRGADIAGRQKIGLLEAMSRKKHYDTQADREARILESQRNAAQEAEDKRAYELEQEKPYVFSDLLRSTWTQEGVPPEEQDARMQAFERSPTAKSFLGLTTTKKDLRGTNEKLVDLMNKHDADVRAGVSKIPKDDFEKSKYFQSELNRQNDNISELNKAKEELNVGGPAPDITEKNFSEATLGDIQTAMRGYKPGQIMDANAVARLQKVYDRQIEIAEKTRDIMKIQKKEVDTRLSLNMLNTEPTYSPEKFYETHAVGSTKHFKDQVSENFFQVQEQDGAYRWIPVEAPEERSMPEQSISTGFQEGL